MNRVRLTGWRSGLCKISLTKTIRAELGYGLAKAKHCTDQVLDGITVVLEVSDAQKAQALAREVDALGVDVILELEEQDNLLTPPAFPAR